jgi:diguanylate cyclase (GGDEF)-like protein/PAS domain S-box-containing protein
MPHSDPQRLTDGTTRQRRRVIVLLIALNVAVGLLLTWLVYSVLQASKSHYIQQADTLAERIVTIAQVGIASELERIDAVIRTTEAELSRLLRDERHADQFAAILASNRALIPEVEALRLSDDSGTVRWGNDLPSSNFPSIADRDNFRLALRDPSERTFVTGPLRSRVSGHWVVVFTRAIRVAGQFKGVLYASVPVTHFQGLLEQYDLTDQDAVTLRNTDLVLVARRAPGSSVQGEVGARKVSARLEAAVASEPLGGAFMSTVAVDGIERITAYRKVSGWPYIVFVGVSRARFLLPWTDQAWRVSMLAALAWMLVAGASVAVYRASVREGAAMRSLAGQARRIQALLRISGDGIHIVDRGGHLVELSDSFAEMLRSSRERLLGRHISGWDVNQDQAMIKAWLAQVKDGDRQRVDVQHRRDDGTIIDVELNMRTAEIGGELLVFSSGRDVTETRRLAREQAAILESDLVGMAKLEDHVVIWRNRAFERIFGYGHGELQGQSTVALYESGKAFHLIADDLHRVFDTGAQYRAQIRMRRKHGEEALWIDLTATGLGEAVTLLMVADITAMKNAHERMAHVAFHDGSTKLPNRLLLADRLEQALNIAEREGSRVAVCYLDLDGFKAVNDTFGHDAGDAVLVAVAGRLQAAIRPSDTVARIGGDEFVLILRSIVSDEWRRVLERIVQVVAEPFPLPGGALANLGVTLGVALSGGSGKSAEQLLSQADHLMLAGKRTKKGGIYL